MNKESLTRSWGRTTLQAKRNSPHIFFAVGLAGVVTSAVLACRATLKLEKELDAIKTDLDSARENKELVESSEGEYSELDYKKDLTRTYAKSSLTVVRLYAPSFALGAISVACLSGSHVQLTRRNAALSSTLAAVSQAFNGYRDRVRAELGEQRELEIYHCLEDNELEIDGKKQIVKAVDPNNPYKTSPYAALFDEKSNYWQKSPEMNRVFLQLMQQQATNKLRAYGHIFLNDVYESIGLPKTRTGQIVGWVYMSDDGDNYVDFCMYEAVDAKVPYDRSIWLDFNVDGPILDSLG